MRILFVCHRFPFPPKRGGKIRPFNIIEFLSRQHDVTVASLARSDEEAREGKGIADYCERYLMGRVNAVEAWSRMLARLPTTKPSSMGYFYAPSLARSIRRELEARRFDLIIVHCSSVAPYVADIRGVPKILDFGDMDSQKWLEYARFKPFPLSIGYRLEGAKLERAEKELATKFDLCTCTTRAEWETLENYGVAARTDWFPNGVDSQYFSPDGQDYEREHICFVGRMDYFPNQQCMFEFCESVLPMIQRRHEGVRLTIVGANPSRAVKALQRLPGVAVTGSVPDVRPYVRRAALTVAPLRIARGTQNKILESLAMGVPVVASVEAAGGIDAVAGRDFLMASTPDELARAVSSLLGDHQRRMQLSNAGRARMLSHHSWAGSMQRFEEIVERLLEGNERSRVS